MRGQVFVIFQVSGAPNALQSAQFFPFHNKHMGTQYTKPNSGHHCQDERHLCGVRSQMEEEAQEPGEPSCQEGNARLGSYLHSTGSPGA